jgi:hypothetical protein
MDVLLFEKQSGFLPGLLEESPTAYSFEYASHRRGL